MNRLKKFYLDISDDYRIVDENGIQGEVGIYNFVYLTFEKERCCAE